MKPTKHVVLLFGQAQSGKTTFGELLATRLPRARAIAFADSIKAAVSLVFGVPLEVLNGTSEAKEARIWYGGRSARWLMRWFGDVIRKSFPLLWLHRTCDEALSADADFVVITDGRLWVERSEPSKYLGDKVAMTTVLLHRPGISHDPPPTMLRRLWRRVLSPLGVEVAMMHPTESEVYAMRLRALAGERLFDEIIVNDGCKDDLARKADDLARALTTRRA